MTYDFSKHKLTLLAEAYMISVYRLHVQGTRIGLVQITFSPEGIAIQGDVVPGGGNGCCSRGKTRAWFAGDLSRDYLAEKFLSKGQHPGLAIATMRDWTIGGDDLPETVTKEDIAWFCRIADEHNWHGLSEALDERGIDTSDGLPGYGYKPGEAETLHAIQQAFARLWATRETP